MFSGKKNGLWKNIFEKNGALGDACLRRLQRDVKSDLSHFLSTTVLCLESDVLQWDHVMLQCVDGWKAVNHDIQYLLLQMDKTHSVNRFTDIIVKALRNVIGATWASCQAFQFMWRFVGLRIRIRKGFICNESSHRQVIYFGRKVHIFNI